MSPVKKICLNKIFLKDEMKLSKEDFLTG